MAAISDAAMLVLYNECLQAIATGQSYAINGRQMTRANLREVRDMIEWLESRIRRDGSTPASQGFGLAQFERPA